MVTVEQMNALLTIVAVAAVSLLASALYRRRMRLRSAAAAARPLCWGPDDKPQRRFKRVLADNSDRPFEHLQREGQGQEMSSKIHPYEKEISLLLEYPQTIINFVTSHECPDMGASYVWIHTEQQLEFLARLLSKEKVFAVDTEQHSVHSFLGFTALMQVSTENEDFLIDTIALHDVMGILRPVFADPTICKVFHGSDSDVLWLQRDFHIYVVNMFDTAKACEVLSKPYKSLAYLLETYCGVSTDKTFQREDWRQRPLSQEMIQYARCDAHYLLYIANCLASELKNETIATFENKYNKVSQHSNMVCLRLYVKENQSSPGVSAVESIYSRNFDMQGMDLSSNCEIKDRLWKMCAWRDLMARIHDDSLRYILSEKAIVALAAKLPKEPINVYDVIAEADSSVDSSSISSVLPSPSPVVISHLNELFCLLQETSATISDVFLKYLKKHRAPTGCCPISVYNYAISPEFSLKGKSTLRTKQSGGKLATPVGRKTSAELFVQQLCKSPVFYNCKIYANDGQLLRYCGRKRMQWYLRQDLAKLVEKDPPAIMLLFKHKGCLEDEDNDFTIQNKENICVGCGKTNHYQRYRVIPSCYKMHFPEHLKSRRYHDTVLLCVDCHEKAHSAAEKYKKQVENEYKIPLSVWTIVDKGEKKGADPTTKLVCEVEQRVSPRQLRTAASNLLRHGSSMPLERHTELMQIVRKYYGGREISSQDLEMALLVGVSSRGSRYVKKKRGLHLEHLEGSAINKVYKSTCSDTIESGINVSVKSQESSKSTDVDVGGRNASGSCIEGYLSEADISPSGSNDQRYYTRKEQRRAIVFTSDNLNGNRDQLADTGGSYPSLPHQVSSKNFKKLTLLGHGSHGKQVVEHLLHTVGEDGIIQFCERWRQVFVEAVRPRFLPHGWDVAQF